jgi:hypothetical protein
LNGHLEALVYLLQCDWSSYDGQLTKVEAMQQALVAGAAMGHIDVSFSYAWSSMNKKIKRKTLLTCHKSPTKIVT